MSTAVLDRRPELAVVDELAHANLPGERHARRWQDVGELLASGIDVYTTLNVANIESLGRGRLPDHRRAPGRAGAGCVRAGRRDHACRPCAAALRRRLAQGLVVPEERVDAALSSYFRFANLAALRELAQLWLDDSVPDPVAAFAAAHGISGPVQASVIVGRPGGVARRRMAHPLRRPPRRAVRRQAPSGARPALDNLDQPPSGAAGEGPPSCSANWAGPCVEVRAGDPASGLIRAARQAGACQLVIGSRRRSRWSRLLNGSTVADQVLRAAGDLPVQVVNVGRPDKTSDEWRRQRHDARQHRTA